MAAISASFEPRCRRGKVSQAARRGALRDAEAGELAVGAFLGFLLGGAWGVALLATRRAGRLERTSMGSKVPRNGIWLVALLTAAGSLTAVLVYRYVDVGRLGVLPNMYEPGWYPLKSYSAVADGIAAISCLGGLSLAMTARRHRA